MTKKTTKIITVNGIKMEVDLRHATVIENFKVGDCVKVLIKNYNGYKSHAAIIVGFDNFNSLPTVIIAYIGDSYSAELEFCYYNAESKDTEICAANPLDIPIRKAEINTKIDREIRDLENKIKDIKQKRHYLNLHFAKYFSDYIEEEAKIDQPVY